MAKNSPISDLDSPQTIVRSFEESNDAHRVNVISGGGLVNQPWDYLAVDSTAPTEDIYTFKNGGVSGTLVATVTINYTDSTKNQILNVAKT